MKKLMFFALAAFSSAAAAEAPFCVVKAYGESCYYNNVQDCQRAAQASGGMCVRNPKAQQQQVVGSAPFCVTQSYGASCAYYDANQCKQAAASQRQACVINPNRQ